MVTSSHGDGPPRRLAVRLILAVTLRANTVGTSHVMKSSLGGEMYGVFFSIVVFPHLSMHQNRKISFVISWGMHYSGGDSFNTVFEKLLESSQSFFSDT